MVLKRINIFSSPENMVSDTLYLAEHHLYGSSRLGVKQYSEDLYYTIYDSDDTTLLQRRDWYSYMQDDWMQKDKAAAYINDVYSVSLDSASSLNRIGTKQYEMTDHLGNVVVTVLDRRTGIGNVGGLYTGWRADVQSMTDYYPFGMPMAERSMLNGGYRFGFNGMEQDNELKGIGNSYDFGARMYDSRVGLFLSLDPLSKQFPSESNYSYAGNSPIYLIDKDGEYKIPAHLLDQYRNDYPMIMKYLEHQIELDIKNSAKIIAGLTLNNPNIKESMVKGIVKWGQGPTIVFVDRLGDPALYMEAAGYTAIESNIHEIQMNSRYASYVEYILKNSKDEFEKLVVFYRFYSTLIHETAHEINKYGKYLGVNEKGKDVYELLPNNGQYTTLEVGYNTEQFIWGTSTYQPFTDYNNFETRQIKKPSGILGIEGPVYRPGVAESVVQEALTTEEGRSTLPTIPTN